MQTGRKNIIANEKGDDKHPDVLSNPSKPQLQAFFNTVISRHNSDPDRITSGGVKGIIHNQTEQHHWGDAYQMHHDDIAKHIGDQDSWNYKTATIGEDGKIIDTRSGHPVLVPGFDSTCLQPARASGASDKASFGEKMGVQTLPTGRKNIVANVINAENHHPSEMAKTADSHEIAAKYHRDKAQQLWGSKGSSISSMKNHTYAAELHELASRSLQPAPAGFSNFTRSADPAAASSDARQASRYANKEGGK